jgi:branched-chain amino acid transport system permease protein
MNEFLQQVINGLAVGGIYALVALGYTMVYGVLKLINFAHGDLFTLGAYLGFTVLGLTGAAGFWPAPLVMGLTVIASMAGIGLAGVALERAAYRPLRNAGRLSAVVSALGASIFLQNAIMLIYGARVVVYPENLRFSLVVDLFGLSLPVARILMIGASVVLMAAL